MYKSLPQQSLENKVSENEIEQAFQQQPILSAQDYTTLQTMDRRYLRFLYNMWSTLKKPRIDLRELNSVMTLYDMLQKDHKEEYLQIVFLPERQCVAKIPSLFPVPSSSFMTHFQANLTTNALGNLAFVWNPFYLSDALNPAPTMTTFFVNNNAALTGTGVSNFFAGVDPGYSQTPASLYQEYRVVGASCVVTYTGRMDIVSGIIGMGVGLTPLGGNAIAGAVDAASQIYGNFSLIDDLYFAKRTQAVNGVRGIYFPLDNRFLNFNPMFTGIGGSLAYQPSLNGFHLTFYGAGLPVSSQCLRVDFYIQYEATVQPIFNNYITQAPGSYSNTNWLEVTSEIIHKNPNVVTQPSSDIPLGFGGTGGAAGVGGLWDFASKLLGKATKFLTSDVGKGVLDAVKTIPGMNIIASGIEKGANMINPYLNKVGDDDTMQG